ncbi:hypothetical protein M3649_04385 [Ureibacillus chungkukjangi]|uniref:hypothetical protein n=1 Tax=Ureibacillus chungkukjangi TaxID=1202712 RepID=UPI00203BD330|nr:hypothetical protein [Ureibacillus chungkukjangi]MCM3387372.1 hypothetical protein [Ureibacillus chungkukjangi]
MDLKGVSTQAFMLLIKLGVFTMEEFQEANKDGYEGLYELLKRKEREVDKQGK